MYEELVSHLRECSKIDPVENTYKEAADAIEELDAICKRQMMEIAVLGKERKASVWIGEGDGYADGNMVYDMWSCGCCGTRFYEWEEKPTWKYCPVCGSHNGGDEDV